MLITLMSLSMALAAGDPQTEPAPLMRVTYADLDFSDPDQSRRFGERAEREASRFCARHRALVTPSHVRARNYCERSMVAAAVRALPRAQWAFYVRAPAPQGQGATGD